MRAALLGQRAGGAHVVRGSAWVLAGVAVGATSGALFWLLAARSVDDGSVGRASAMFTSVLFVNYATTLGLPIAVAAFAADRSSDAGARFSWAIVLTAASSSVGGFVYLLAVAPDAREVLFRWSEPGGLAVFALIATGAAIAVLDDVRLMAARRWGWVLVRSAGVGLVRIPLLPLNPGLPDDTWLFLLSAGVLAFSGFAGLALLPRLTGLRPSLRRPPAGTGRAARYAAVNYASMLASNAPAFVLPVLVLLHVGAEENARFFVAWSIVSVVFLVPQNVGNVLVVEGHRGHDLAGPVRASLAVATATMALCLAGTLVVGRAVLAVYGDGYAEAAGTLRGLMVAGLPWAVTSTGLGWARVRHDTAATIGITLTLASAVCLPALWLVPEGGATAAAWCWVGGHVAAAAVAAGAWWRLRGDAVRHPGDRRSPGFVDRPPEVVPS